MRTRTAARTPAPTELGSGAARLGDLGRVTSDADASGAVDAASRSGVRHFDTAPHYGPGLSERRRGAALSRRFRARYTVSTEVGRRRPSSPTRSGTNWPRRPCFPRARRSGPRRDGHERHGLRAGCRTAVQPLRMERHGTPHNRAGHGRTRRLAAQLDHGGGRGQRLPQPQRVGHEPLHLP
ncbi:aldo/keto reductase [Streptomyces sp. NPDC056749]|uniref:aldo/keto reductase n=1 Tax=Streptomyces sp. NPDC056749 TaxID=3345936 RepID=UPI0036814DFB